MMRVHGISEGDTDRLLATLEGGLGTLGAFSQEVGAVLESVVRCGGADVEGGREGGGTSGGTLPAPGSPSSVSSL